MGLYVGWIGKRLSDLLIKFNEKLVFFFFYFRLIIQLAKNSYENVFFLVPSIFEEKWVRFNMIIYEQL